MLGAFLEGVRRVSRAPVVLLSVSAAVCLLVLPHRLSLFGALPDTWYLRTVLDRALWEWHGGWMLAGYHGAIPPAPGLASAALAATLLWLFLSGGVLDRFARARPIRTSAFFAASGEFFVRFLRLSLVTAPVYWWLFAWLFPRLTSTTWGQLGFVAALGFVNLVTDYARVRAVVEDRRSMIGAIGASLRFIRRRPLRVAGLYLLGMLPSAVAIRLWFGMSTWPEATAGSLAAALVVYVVLRTWARLTWMAGEVVFFQRELAHATCTGRPLPEWPESPAAEAIANLGTKSLR
ncbi:MAG: hypothetical protein FJW21_02135 [Acidimicrobiia bacterium]|nr:hypothetical protein [Acidimicrobiia bacterium]